MEPFRRTLAEGTRHRIEEAALVDPERVRRRLRDMDHRTSLLEEIRARGRAAFLGDIGLRAQAERHLQLLIQAAIDIATHVVAEDSSVTPEDYGSTFALLADMGVIDSDLVGDLRAAAGFRKVLVHAYLEVDPERVWDHLSSLVLTSARSRTFRRGHGHLVSGPARGWRLMAASLRIRVV